MFQFDFRNKIHKIRIALKGSRKKSPFFKWPCHSDLTPRGPLELNGRRNLFKKIYIFLNGRPLTQSRLNGKAKKKKKKNGGFPKVYK